MILKSLFNEIFKIKKEQFYCSFYIGLANRSFNLKTSVHDKFHRTLVLSGFFFLKIASTFLNSSFFPKPIKRRIAI